jgi:hypothetical protein
MMPKPGEHRPAGFAGWGPAHRWPAPSAVQTTSDIDTSPRRSRPQQDHILQETYLLDTARSLTGYAVRDDVGVAEDVRLAEGLMSPQPARFLSRLAASSRGRGRVVRLSSIFKMTALPERLTSLVSLDGNCIYPSKLAPARS